MKFEDLLQRAVEIRDKYDELNLKKRGGKWNERDYRTDFKNQRVTMMGLGLLGRGVGDAEFFLECGARLTITDKKTGAELSSSVERLRDFARERGVADENLVFHLGGHDEADFTDCDLVVKAAGVPQESPFIAAARAAGVPVVMTTALFARYARAAGVTLVGITGTRGKSTVTQMIYSSLALAGRRALLGGNVRGVSTLALLSEVQSGDVAVLELDSWQLQGFGDLGISPDVAVFTNLMIDHQNYYRNMDDYFADKAKIFANQEPDDVLLVGAEVKARILAARPPVLPVAPPDVPDDWKLQTVGAHNRANAALAAAALRALGLTESEIRGGLEAFTPVEGRLQFVGEKRGVKIYNDNNATTPEATVAALRALGEDGLRNVILIAGGADKGLPVEGLVAEIERHCRAVVLLEGTGTPKLVAELPQATVCGDLKTAVATAMGLGQTGDILLFSPSFASFGLFANEYERGDEFLKLIGGYQSM